MKRIKRILAVLVLIVLALLLSYLVFTGKAVASIGDGAEAVQAVMFYG